MSASDKDDGMEEDMEAPRSNPPPTGRPAARRSRHRIHGNPFAVRGEIAMPDWASIYGRAAPFALDIGYGAGEFLLSLAQAHPEWNVLGLEIRRHFVDDVLAEAKVLGLTNLHALLANANVHLDGLLPGKSVAFLSVNFPDPWFKKRHQKRRVFRPDFLAMLLPKLQPGAQIHAMSDYQPVAEEIREVLAAEPRLRCLHEPPFAQASTTGLTSERERSHSKRGHPVYRVAFAFDR